MAKSGKVPKDHLFQSDGGGTAFFLVEVGDVPVGRFTECSGLEVQIEVETYEEGGVNGFSHQLPGRMTWPNLVLKRGITTDNGLFEWFNESVGTTFNAESKTERKTVDVTMVSASGERLRTWTLYDAMPVKWTGPSFAKSNDDVATEELELAHHGFSAETLKK